MNELAQRFLLLEQRVNFLQNLLVSSNLPNNTKLVNATNGTNGQQVTNPFGVTNLIIMSSDNLWTAIVDSTALLHLVGPPDETFTGIMIAVNTTPPTN